jgi:hypothetical protein
MGLDMYLTAVKPGSNPNNTDARLEVGYWRKANAIHAWFVDNVQGGVDECQESPVTREQLQTLFKLCEAVFTQGYKPESPLQPRAGFFFGNTDINGFFYEDLRKTIDILYKAFDDEYAGYDFVYQASW